MITLSHPVQIQLLMIVILIALQFIHLVLPPPYPPGQLQNLLSGQLRSFSSHARGLIYVALSVYGLPSVLEQLNIAAEYLIVLNEHF